MNEQPNCMKDYPGKLMTWPNPLKEWCDKYESRYDEKGQAITKGTMRSEPTDDLKRPE